MSKIIDLINQQNVPAVRYMAGPNADDLTAPRDPQVAANIATWQQIIEYRYAGNRYEDMLSLLDPTYRWYGTVGADYGYQDNEERQTLLSLAKSVQQAFANLSITHHMFGEGCMVGNYFFIEGRHEGDYYDIAATGRPIKMLGLAIARFNPQGQLVEERELTDEMTLLRQLGFIKDQDAAGVSGLFHNMNAFPPVPPYPPMPIPPIEEFLFNRGVEMDTSQRDPIVVRNIINWRRFTDVKYKYQNWGTVEEVMSPHFFGFHFGGMKFDYGDLETRARLFDFFEKELIEHPDMHFDSRLFGEGNIGLYNVIPQFTHTGTTWGVEPTGRPARMFNISIGRFDQQGRILEETEVHDMLAVYKQLGFIEDNKNNLSLLGVLRNL
jgi:predicted ester cyclase